MLTALVFLGLTKSFFGWFGGIQHDPVRPAQASKTSRQAGGTLSLFLLLQGFSSGAVALTGVEAISNGVPAFRRPESKNAAARSPGWRSSSARCSSACRSSRTTSSRIRATTVTVFAQMGKQVFGDNFVFWILQLATAGILTLAANTAYADFPRLSSIIARDGYLPRQLANRGDRLVFSNGVLVLAVVGGRADRRVRRQDQRADPAVRGRRVHLVHAVAGGHGAAPPEGARAALEARRRRSTASARSRPRSSTIIIASTKFTEGAWIPLVVIPMIVLLFKAIKQHYDERRRRACSVPADYKPRRMNHTVVVLVGSVHRGVLEALAYAKSLHPEPPARGHRRLRRGGAGADRASVVRASTSTSRSRSCTRRTASSSGPILRFIDELDARYENNIITVVLPEFVVGSWWGQLLHNQSALLLKGRLLFRKGTVVTSVPYHLERCGRPEPRGRATVRAPDLTFWVTET